MDPEDANSALSKQMQMQDILDRRTVEVLTLKIEAGRDRAEAAAHAARAFVRLISAESPYVKSFYSCC
jgi:hypothetical protein